MRNPLTISLVLICTLKAFSLAPCKFEVNLSGEDINCFGESNGEASIDIVQVSGDSGPYSVEWFDGNTSLFRNDLPAGTHFVEVTDNEGCVVIEFITLNEPEELQLSASQVNVQCHGASDGSIALTVVGGVTPYFYQWSNGDDTADISTLIVGDYTVTVFDDNGCSTQLTTSLTEPEPLGINPTITPVSCSGGTDGEIKTVVFGGVLPYSYSWSSGDTIPTARNLASGTHSLTITDGNGCLFLADYVVNEPPPIQINFEVTDLSCFEEADGEIFASVTGGTPSYLFEWSNSDKVLGDTTNNPAGLVSDFYKLRLTDDNGCIAIDSVFVGQPSPLVLNLESYDASCFDNTDGSIDLSISGGREPYAILWSTGAESADINGLSADEYSVVVADATGCSQLGRITVDQPDSLNFNVTITEVSCKDQQDGEINIKPTGGTPDYVVNWSNGSTDFSISELDGDTYTVNVVDANDCPYDASFEVPVNPVACITNITIPSAFTPNGDSFNDVWNIKNSEVYPQIFVRVFDKWGNLIFDSIGYLESWNGRIGSKQAPESVYYYIVNLNNGDPPFNGTVTLVR